MAETTVVAGLTPQQWDDQFFMEFVRESRFKRYMGSNENSIIHVKEDLERKPGDKVTFANVRKLTDTGRTGHQVLEGFEERLDNRSMTVTVNPLRHAVAIDKWTAQKSAIDLRNAAKQALKLWEMEKLRDSIILALGSINGVVYADATEAQKDAWLVDNRDRALFGALEANSVSLDHSTSLATIDNTADKLSPAMISLAKRKAQMASPAIKPIRTTMDDEEWFVMFANSLAFRDLSLDAVMTQANRDARERGVATNPLFTGGSLVWDGVIIREIPEIAVVTGVGAAGINVGPNYLVGAQAIGVAWAERPRSVTDVRDYGYLTGVGIEQMRGVEKLIFGKGASDTADLVQHGTVTTWASAVADA